MNEKIAAMIFDGGAAKDPEGTSVKSTNVTSGKVLTADGDGTSSWQNAGGGSFPSDPDAGDAVVYDGTSWSKQSGYGYETSEDVTVTWDGNTTGKSYIEMNGIPYYNIDNSDLKLSDLDGADVKLYFERSIINVSVIDGENLGDVYWLFDVSEEDLVITSGDATKFKFLNEIIDEAYWTLAIFSETDQTFSCYHVGAPDEPLQLNLLKGINFLYYDNEGEPEDNYYTQQIVYDAVETNSIASKWLSNAVLKSQGTSKAGQFLVVGSDGNVTTQSISTWQGGNY